MPSPVRMRSEYRAGVQDVLSCHRWWWFFACFFFFFFFEREREKEKKREGEEEEEEARAVKKKKKKKKKRRFEGEKTKMELLAPVHAELCKGAVEGDAVRVGGGVDRDAVALDEEGRGLLLATVVGRGRGRERRRRCPGEEGFPAVGFRSRRGSASTRRRDALGSLRGESRCREWHARARRSQERGGAHGRGALEWGARESF